MKGSRKGSRNYPNALGERSLDLDILAYEFYKSMPDLVGNLLASVYRQQATEWENSQIS